MRKFSLYIFMAALLACACNRAKPTDTAPWGDVVDEDTAASQLGHFSIEELQTNGEMIMLTMSGPDTYFDYRGRTTGTQYLLCEKFAHSIGVALRVEVCKDTAEMVRRLKAGEGDIIVFQLPTSTAGLEYCGYGIDSLHTSWAVMKGNREMADTIDHWYSPALLAQVKREEDYMFSARSIRRHAYSPMLNAKAGVISRYDHLFQKYAPLVRWDWRLMAAQCYQESTFDPRAYSWAGACGLMQIMPATATQVGLEHSQIYDPEQNVAAATRYIQTLNAKFQDIRDANERRQFVLASYNGGFFHIRDAMALARKYGRNPQRWADVAEYVLKLSQPQYYKDPVVKYGYMRGQETAGYVESINSRWAQYRGMAKGGTPFFGSPGTVSPQKASKKHRFKL